MCRWLHSLTVGLLQTGELGRVCPPRTVLNVTRCAPEYFELLQRRGVPALLDGDVSAIAAVPIVVSMSPIERISRFCPLAIADSIAIVCLAPTLRRVDHVDGQEAAVFVLSPAAPFLCLGDILEPPALRWRTFSIGTARVARPLGLQKLNGPVRLRVLVPFRRVPISCSLLFGNFERLPGFVAVAVPLRRLKLVLSALVYLWKASMVEVATSIVVAVATANVGADPTAALKPGSSTTTAALVLKPSRLPLVQATSSLNLAAVDASLHVGWKRFRPRAATKVSTVTR